MDCPVGNQSAGELWQARSSWRPHSLKKYRLAGICLSKKEGIVRKLLGRESDLANRACRFQPLPQDLLVLRNTPIKGWSPLFLWILGSIAMWEMNPLLMMKWGYGLVLICICYQSWVNMYFSFITYIWTSSMVSVALGTRPFNLKFINFSFSATYREVVNKTDDWLYLISVLNILRTTFGSVKHGALGPWWGASFKKNVVYQSLFSSTKKWQYSW